MKKVLAIILMGLLLTGLIGCSQEKPAPQPQEDKPAETKEVTLQIEGNDEEKLFKLLYDNELGFYTYYPEDMLPEAISSEAVKGYRIVANFGGVKSEDVFTEILFLSEAVETQQEAMALFIGEIEARGLELVEEAIDLGQNSWALEGVRLQKGDIMMTGYLAEAQEGFMWISKQLVPEYADGMGPRFAKIADELVLLK